MFPKQNLKILSVQLALFGSNYDLSLTRKHIWLTLTVQDWNARDQLISLL